MKIFCFFQPMGGFVNVTDNLLLISLWLRAWREVGFEPYVLGYNDVGNNPLFHQMLAAAERLPTVVGKEFSEANYVRWCVSHLSADEWWVMADYDVFPTAAFSASILEECRTFARSPILGLGGDWERGPGFMLGNTATFSTLAGRIVDYQMEPGDMYNGQPHVSDMDIIRKRNEGISFRNWTMCYGREGWRDYPLCHFGNGYMKRSGEVPKWMEIAQVLGYNTSVHACSPPRDAVNGCHEHSEPGNS